MSFDALPLELILRIASLMPDDYHYFYNLCLGLPRLGRALISAHDPARPQSTLTVDQRAALLAVYRIEQCDERGITITKLHGWLHSFHDQPAIRNDTNAGQRLVICMCPCMVGDLTATLESYIAPGDQLWFRHGQRHREADRPATIRAGGDMIWCRNDVFHRDHDRPAIVMYANQLIYWYKAGKQYTPDDCSGGANELD